MKAGPNRRSAGGFTLLEALLALTVFATAFALVLDTLARGLRNTRLAADLTQATLWAQNRLDAIGVVEKLAPDRSSGRFDTRYSYDLEVEPYEPVGGPTQADANFPVQLYKVVLTVYWNTETGQRSERFVTVKSRLKEGAFF